MESTIRKRMSVHGVDSSSVDEIGSNDAVLEMKELRNSDSIHINDNDCTDETFVINNNNNSNNDNINTAANTEPSTSISYPDLAYRAFGSKGKTIVMVGIASMQSGICLTYLIFVPQNMRSSCRALFEVDLSPLVFLWAMVLVQIPLSWIREFRLLTISNTLANGLILYGLIICLGFAFSNAIIASPAIEDDNNGSNAENENGGYMAEVMYKFVNLKPFNSNFYLFIGTSVLLFEGSITLLIPIQEAISNPQDRQHFPKMYPNVILCIIWFYTFFGTVGWLSFGDDVHTVMTTSLPENNALVTSVQMAYSVAVLLTFPLQNFPALEIICTAISTGLQKLSTTVAVRRNDILFRILRILKCREVLSSLIVCFLALIATVTMDNLDKVVSLMGGLLGCPLAFVFPPLIHNQLALTTPTSGSVGYHLSSRRRLQNKIVASLGIGAMIVSTIATILKW